MSKRVKVLVFSVKNDDRINKPAYIAISLKDQLDPATNSSFFVSPSSPDAAVYRDNHGIREFLVGIATITILNRGPVIIFATNFDLEDHALENAVVETAINALAKDNGWERINTGAEPPPHPFTPDNLPPKIRDTVTVVRSRGEPQTSS